MGTRVRQKKKRRTNYLVSPMLDISLLKALFKRQDSKERANSNFCSTCRPFIFQTIKFAKSNGKNLSFEISLFTTIGYEAIVISKS